jgi:hypothetical protein
VRRSPARHGRMISGAAALTTLVVCLGSATPAMASGKTKLKPLKDPLASARTKALADVTVYGKRLTLVLRAGAVSSTLSPDELLGLHDAGVLEGVAVRDDRVAVTRAKTKKAIAAAVSSAQRSVSVASLQLSVATAAEAHLAAGNPFGDDAATLSDDATTAAAAGADTTDVTSALDALAIDLESAQGDESTTFSDVLSLDADATSAALKAAAVSAVSDLSLVDQDISNANDDLAAAQTAYDGLSAGDGSGDGSGDGAGDGNP